MSLVEHEIGAVRRGLVFFMSGHTNRKESIVEKLCEICDHNADNCECADYGFSPEDCGWEANEDSDED